MSDRAKAWLETHSVLAIAVAAYFLGFVVLWVDTATIQLTYSLPDVAKDFLELVFWPPRQVMIEVKSWF